jgi:hypothetical protein
MDSLPPGEWAQKELLVGLPAVTPHVLIQLSSGSTGPSKVIEGPRPT